MDSAHDEKLEVLPLNGPVDELVTTLVEPGHAGNMNTGGEGKVHHSLVGLVHVCGGACTHDCVCSSKDVFLLNKGK